MPKESGKQLCKKGIASFLAILFVLAISSSCKKKDTETYSENNTYIVDENTNQFYDEYNRKLNNEYFDKYNLFKRQYLDETNNKIIDSIFKELCKIDENFNKLDNQNFREYVMSYFISPYEGKKLNFFDVKKILNSINVEKRDSQTSVKLNVYEGNDEYQNINFGTSEAGGFLTEEAKNSSTYIYSFINSNTILYDITSINQDVDFGIKAYINEFNMHIRINCNDLTKIIYTTDEDKIYGLFRMIVNEYSYGDFNLVEFVKSHEDQLIYIFGEDIFEELKKEEKRLVLN